MKKIFEIEWDSKFTLLVSLVEFLINKEFSTSEFKVKELTECCECIHDWSAGAMIRVNDIKKMECADCGKPIKLKETIYPKEVTDKINAAFEQPKKIEPLRIIQDRENKVVDKINEIITHINNS